MNRVYSQTVASLGGRDIILFRLNNAQGDSVELLNYGATLVSVNVPDRTGKRENVLLRYYDPKDYLSDPFYLGSTVGRFANRISKAQIKLGGTLFDLEKNDGENCNHGGFSGFHKKVFQYTPIENGIIFSSESFDGEGGFPGNLRFSVRYTFSDERKLSIEYDAVCDQETVINLTNHAYFNLSGNGGSIEMHELEVNADAYLESDDMFLPTGKILPVAGSAFDFISYKSIVSMMPLKKEILKGYNTYFIAKELSANCKLLASLREKQSGRMLKVYATAPGIQVYTGDYLSGKFAPRSGVCLEAQGFPDAPNHTNFPSCILLPGDEYKQKIVYEFGVY